MGCKRVWYGGRGDLMEEIMAVRHRRWEEKCE